MELGKKVRISREKVVDFILDSIDGINQESKKNLSIQDAFKCCGLNPSSSKNSLNAFKQHLDALEENNVLKAMILSNQKAVELS